jgi:hypothetical protein
VQVIAPHENLIVQAPISNLSKQQATMHRTIMTLPMAIVTAALLWNAAMVAMPVWLPNASLLTFVLIVQTKTAQVKPLAIGYPLLPRFWGLVNDGISIEKISLR